MSINWYPGHMVKARKVIEENLKLVDIVAFILDARAPFSCRNPELEALSARRQAVYILNKSDLALPNYTSQYLARLREEGKLGAAIDSSSGRGSKQVVQILRTAFEEQRAKLQQQGRRVRPARIMIVGVPNVGKSTFINCLAGKKMASTGAKPGITRGKQWVRTRDDMEFLDTPGLMWPKIVDEEQGLKLALLNIVGEKSYSELEVALYLIKFLKNRAPDILIKNLKVDILDQDEDLLLQDIARKRGHLLKGGKPDTEKTCSVLLQDFRKGKLGRNSLD